MNESHLKELRRDPDGLKTYEYIANHIDDEDFDIDALVENMTLVDLTGQFTASAARYLNAIDPEGFAPAIRHLVSVTIDKDREHQYLGDILNSIYGDDYAERAEELSATDDNFRRIYKRLYPTNPI